MDLIVIIVLVSFLVAGGLLRAAPEEHGVRHPDGSVFDAIFRPEVEIRDGTVVDVPVRGPAGVREAAVVLPRVWMKAVEALIAAHRQTGALYAIVPPRFDAPVGPFPFGEPVTVDELTRCVAEGTGTRRTWVNDVAVFDPAEAEAGGTSGGGPLAEVSALDARGDSSAAVRLTRLAGHEDGAVRLHALAALARLEGDFMRGTYPGRVSFLEVVPDRIDREALLYAVEAGGPLGCRVWKLAVEILGRARARVLARYLWWHVWLKREGVMEVGLWALGRCGDPSAAWSMRGRIRETFTNEPSHRYLAAMALGQLNAVDRLTADLHDDDADLRRACAFGLGFCRAAADEAVQHLTGLLDDADPSVRFVACQSLARLGTGAAVRQLMAVSSNGEASADRRTAAMEALVAMGRPEAAETALAHSEDEDPAVRAQAAALLGEIGGPRAQDQLMDLAGDEDRRVRAAAVCALARLGTAQGLGRAAAVLNDSQPDADERIAALLGLGRSYAPEAAAPLAAVARDLQQPERLRQYAILGLVRLGRRAGQPTLHELADRTSPAYLPLAVRELDLDTPEATAVFLIPYLTHADRDGACAAAGRLAEMGYGPAVVELLEGSDVFDNHTRMMHLWGTVRATGRGVVLALVEAARNRRVSIRRTAAFALGGRLYPEAVDALLRLAGDPDGGVRAAAVQSLGLSADPRAVGVLVGLATGDEDLRVAHEAVRALRLRDFRDAPEVQEVARLIVGTPRDAGGLPLTPPSVADQPDHSFVLRTWAEHVEEDLVCNLTYEASICYDSHNDRAVAWGAHGRRYDTPQTAQTWFFDAAGGQWRRLTTSRQWPNGVCGTRGTMFDRTNKAVVSPRSGGSNAHGWHNALSANLLHSSPWVMDATTDQWYAARTEGFWAGGYMPGSHDPVHGINLWWRGGLKGFDVYANQWIDFEVPGPAPACPGDTGGEFDPRTGRFIALAQDATWAFDPATNAWTDLQPTGDHPPPCPMVYDTANDVMLAFKALEHEVGVWVYHIRENRWERLPAVFPCPARGKIWDVTYDEKNNVVIIPGTEPRIGQTASLNNRETWTYRYRRAAAEADGALAPPQEVHCRTTRDGRVTLKWRPGECGRAVRFLIERGIGPEAWHVQWEPVGEVEGTRHDFTDQPGQLPAVNCRKDGPPPGGHPADIFYYRVLAVAADGAVSRPSAPGRTAPRMIHQVTAVVRAEGGVHLTWSDREGSDAAGFHVYRAPVDLGSPWHDRFDPGSVFDRLERITDEPVAGTDFVDAGATVAGPADELTWPKTYAYVVRPVNAWGVEGGPSPVTLALPDPPGPVRVVPWADGRRLVLWGTCLSGGVAGYHLHRMDDWHSRHVFRLEPAPLASPGFWDDEDVPTHDRRRYFAVGVDSLGALGHPTGGAWSHGFP